MKKRGTSAVPLIMGIIGSVISIPSALCAGLCAGVTSSVGSGYLQASMDNNMEAMEALGGNVAQDMWLPIFLALSAGIIGLIGGILGKRMPNIAGILMLIATVLSAISAVYANLIGVLVAILFLIGTAFCFAQKKEEIK